MGVFSGSFRPDPAKFGDLIGSTYRYLGFISTSRVLEKAQANAGGRSDLAVILEFRSPAGLSAIDMQAFPSVGGGEFELLLGPGEFKIIEAFAEEFRRTGRPHEKQQCLRVVLEPMPLSTLA